MTTVVCVVLKDTVAGDAEWCCSRCCSRRYFDEVCGIEAASLKGVGDYSSDGKRWDLLFVAGPLDTDGVTEGESTVDVNEKAFRRLSLIARAGFRLIAPRFSEVGVAVNCLTPLRVVTVGVSGLSPCKILTFTMSISSLARVFERSSMSCCASAHFSDASSWISAYEADIFTGMGVVFVDVVGEEGEGGLVEAEDAWREFRMYLAESLSISCWSSDSYSHLNEDKHS